MHSRRQKHVNAMQTQALEQRICLAGNVTASLINGKNLNLVGDEFDNNIRVREVAAGIRVTGRQGTTINGETGVTFPKTGPGVKRNLTISLGDGNDRALVENLTVGNRTNIGGGGGHDVFDLDTLESNNGLILDGRNGNDIIGIRDVDAGFVDLQLGGGNDVVGFINTEIDGDVTIVGANGRDSVLLQDTIIHGESFAKMENGNDFLLATGSQFRDRVRVRGMAGNDVVVDVTDTSANHFFGNVSVNGGSGTGDVVTTDNDSLRDGAFNVPGVEILQDENDFPGDGTLPEPAQSLLDNALEKLTNAGLLD